MTKGRVIKNYNGYYYVDVGRDSLIECRRRGKLLKAKILVGDELEITELENDKGVIEAQLPRRNQIRRPAVANLDQLMVIMAAQSPDPNRFLIDKMLMTCEYSGIRPILCFNKCDLDRDVAESYRDFYERCGYDVCLVSARTGEGLDALYERLPQKVTAFAGPSGVGKSSLLSQLLGRKDLSIGAVSEKIKRGRHTTRHSEIMRLTATPTSRYAGVQCLDFEHLDARDVLPLFPDMEPYSAGCKFSSCLHLSEPECAVKQAVADGQIQKERYETYCKIITSIGERKR